MKKGLLFTAVVLLAATSVFAGTLTVISSFPSSKQWRKGIEVAGGYVYETSNYSDNSIIYYTTSGSQVGTIPTPSSAMGLEITNAPSSYLWLNTFSPANGYRMLLSTGSVINSFSGPASGYGITSDGTYLYWSTTSNDMMYRMTTTGSVLNSWAQPSTFPGGCDYMAPGYIWTSGWSSTNGIYLCTTAGSVVDSFNPATIGCTSTSGVCWDGTNLWCHNYSGTGLVYRCNANFTGVTPTSVGKIKTIFR